MTSSERILAGIAEEGQKQSAEILAKAESEAKAFLDNAKAEAQKKADALIEQAERKAELVRSSGRSAAQLLKRDAALKAKREWIDRVLQDTVSDICAFSDEDYFAFLLPLITRGKMEGEGELLLSARDLSRDTALLCEKIAPLSLKISDTPAEIEGGFVLKYGDIFINGELSALIREKREELVDNIHSILFKKV